jgi:C1A family cysteine protease
MPKIVILIIIIFLFSEKSLLLIKNRKGLKKEMLLFENWFTLHKKVYKNAEYEYRLKIFKDNLDLIESHNKSNSSYKLGQTIFADLTDEEFMSMFPKMDKYTPKEKSKKKVKKTVRESKSEKIEELKLEKQVDWVALGKVVPPQDQMKCGSCYAFSATAAAESLYAIQNNTKAIPFSKQYMVDCGYKVGLRGCDGGISYDAFNFLKNFGAIYEKDDPYYAVERKCYLKNPVFKISGAKSIPSKVVNLLEEISKGPILVTIEIVPSLKLYDGGVYETKAPCGFFFNHAVTGVGYNLNTEYPYIYLKNSWGTEWGENGYLKWFTGDNLNTDGMCFVANNNNFRPY